ncbi:hypothetical protein DT73_00570 [Mangrovibacter sp. MFB070]|uniref:DUF1889 family protein n=1 Tax=Mangrovibacter sp. MFB070 TaxID=1224318 RepID=UPI0004D391E0|nr:DUF1889 family protein [Mangrovibacter sp. MFB070]KEA54400.1 hypothetical protein DT73_00570 [Mangrovibacter sp. MFB070]
MPTIKARALKELDGMNTSTSAPHAQDESTAKEMFKYLKDLGHPLTGSEIIEYGKAKGWNGGFIKKMAGWADKVASGGRVVVKHPGQLTDELKKYLKG